MDSKKRLIEIQGTAEGKAFTRKEFDSLLDLAEKGLSEVLSFQRLALE